MSDMLKDLAETMRWMFHGRARDFLRNHHAEIAQNAEAANQLGELLAVIHADGGHYLADHGAKKSTADAISIWVAHMRALDEGEMAAKRLRALEMAMWEARRLHGQVTTGWLTQRAEGIMRELTEGAG